MDISGTIVSSYQMTTGELSAGGNIIKTFSHRLLRITATGLLVLLQMSSNLSLPSIRPFALARVVAVHGTKVLKPIIIYKCQLRALSC